MTVVGLALRSLRQRALATALTAAVVALGVGLALAVDTAVRASGTAFTAATRGYDVVVFGRRTTALSAVLNVVFHADRPADKVSVDVVTALREDPRVLHAVPMAVGDVFRGFRVVGTTAGFFDAVPDAAGRPIRERLAAGKVFGDGPEFEAVVGSVAASRTGLGVGSRFTVSHGLETSGPAHEHKEEWTVVGVLAPTGTPNDRAVFITLRSFFHVEGHEHADGHEHDHDHGFGPEVHEVSTVLVRLKVPAQKFLFVADWNRRDDSAAAVPALEVMELSRKLSDVRPILDAVARLVLVASGLAILASLWTAVLARRREVAILRALGARRSHVVAVVVLESVLTCVAGAVAGVALAYGLLAGAGPWLLDLLGVRLEDTALDPAHALRVASAALVVGLLAGALPAWRAYRVPVARHLHPD